MMSFYEGVFYLFIYSVLGWTAEVLYEKVTTDRFINKGFLNGPLCPIYGFGAVFFLICLKPFQGHFLLVFLFSFLIATFLEYIASFILEYLFHKRWWDYRDYAFNLNGRVCLLFSSFWGVGGVLILYFIHPIVMKAVSNIPQHVGIVFLCCVAFFILLDLFMTMKATLKLSHIIDELVIKTAEVKKEAGSIYKTYASRLGTMQRRILQAFPDFTTLVDSEVLSEIRKYLIKEKKKPVVPKESKSFLTLYHLLCFFVLGSFVGFIFENIVCFIQYGTFYSRKGLIYGPFVPIYGGGLVLFILFFGNAKSNSKLFWGGMMVGGAFEYICSLVQEYVFGTRSWYYTKNFLNFAGRTSPFHMTLWGCLTFLFMKVFYKSIVDLLNKVKTNWKHVLVVLILVFMGFDIGISWVASVRQKDRHYGIAPCNAFEVWLDKTYPDERLDRIFSNKWWAK